MAGICITKIIREHHEVDISITSGATTIGGGIDTLIAEALANGDTVQEVSLEVAPQEWEAMLAAYHGTPDPRVKRKASNGRQIREGDF